MTLFTSAALNLTFEGKSSCKWY